MRFSGTIDRPPLAEVTELDPPLPTGARTRLVADGARLLVLAESLPAAAVVEANTGSWHWFAWPARRWLRSSSWIGPDSWSPV